MLIYKTRVCESGLTITLHTMYVIAEIDKYISISGNRQKITIFTLVFLFLEQIELDN